MKSLLSAALAAFLVAALPAAVAQNKSEGKDAKPAKQDMRAMQRIAQANMAEVETGKVALDKASSGEVKKFAQHMVDDHGKMLQEAQQMAQSKGMKVPEKPDAKHAAALKMLQGLSGEQFDRRYMNQMVKDHEDTLNLLKKTSSSAKDPDLKAAAQKAAPDVEQHLKMAKDIQSSLGGGKNEKSSEKSGSKKQ
jgi:putative membrane protein